MSDKTAFHSILVPVDGSTLAEAAIPYALAVAERARSRVQFVFVYQDRIPLEPVELAWQYLLRLTARARERLGDSVSCALLHGPVAATLVKQARKIGADLVIMTTHGRGGLERAWLGSVTDQLIRRVGIPVLVAQPCEDGSAPRVRAQRNPRSAGRLDVGGNGTPARGGAGQTVGRGADSGADRLPGPDCR